MVAMPPQPKTTLPRPDLPPPDELGVFDAELRDEGHYEYLRAVGTSWDSAFADHARFSQCVFDDVTLGGGEWAHATFADVRFEDSRWVAPDLSRSHWRDSELRRGLASGVQWYDADVR